MATEQKNTTFNSNSLIRPYSSILHIMVGFTGWFVPQILKLGDWKGFTAKFFKGESGGIVIQGRKPEHRFKFDWNFEEKWLTITRVNEKDEGPLNFYPDELPNPKIAVGACLVETNRVTYDFTKDIENWKKRNRVQRPS